MSFVLGINVEVGAFILEGSISENFPKATNKEVSCYELNADVPANRKIQCFGIG